MKLGMIRGYSEDFFRYTKDHGLDFIEVCTNYDNETEAFIANIEETKKLIDKYELPILSVGRWNSEPIKDGKIDAAVKDMLKEQIDKTAYIGCPVFNMGVNRDESVSLFKNYVLAVEYLREMSDYARERGVTVALYNCSWSNFLCETKTWEIVLPELPDVMIKYDCSHAYARGADYLSELYRWADRLAHMHIKGSNIADGRYIDDPPAGIDALDWRRIFSILYARGYDGTLSIEPHSAIWQGELGERGVLFTIDYIRQYMLR
jgi:sugar phosphate isomerase/epimerase